MKYYTEEGYLNMEEIISDPNPFIFIVCSRGSGKTFGALKYIHDHDQHFILMRRTQTQADMVQSDELNPFKSLYTELGEDYLYKFKKVAKSITGIYKEADGQLERKGLLLALSTISNIRGFDASDVDILIYDEFIGEKHERPIKHEGIAFLNAIETIGRNRELKGKPALKVICMANSNDLANPLFIQLGLVRYAEKMIRKEIEKISLPERSLSLYILNHSPISQKKADTALYRLSGKSEFTDMAISNSFSLEFTEMVRSLSLKEYRPLVAVGEIVIYQHKSDLRYYVTDHLSGKPEIYGSSEIDIQRFSNNFYHLKLSYLNRHIYFESYVLQVLFEKYFKLCYI